MNYGIYLDQEAEIVLKYINFHLINSKIVLKCIIHLSAIDKSFPYQDYSVKTLQLAFHHEEICIRLVSGREYKPFITFILLLFCT